MSLAQRFERRLESMVGSAFARVFKGQVEPVEIGSALQREATDKKSVMSNGQLMVPNRYRVTLSRSDYDRLAPWEEQLCQSLAELVQEHLDDNSLRTVGDVTVLLALDEALHTGVFGVASRMEGAAPPRRRPYDSMSMPVVPGHVDEYVEPYGSHLPPRASVPASGSSVPAAPVVPPVPVVPPGPPVFSPPEAGFPVPGFGHDEPGQGHPDAVFDHDAADPERAYAADPYAPDPYARDPYAADPYAPDSYAAGGPAQAGYPQPGYGSSYESPPYAEPPRRANLRAQLIVDGTPRSLTLRGGSNIVGRGSETDLQLLDQGVSRRHLDIHISDGVATAYDLHSTNGTTVNGHPVSSALLQHGDVIRVGHTRLVYQQDS